MTRESTYLRRDQIRRSQRGYYRRNADKLRAASAARDAQNPERRDERNERFKAKNPTYWREYYHRRRMRLAWQRFVRICAANRALTSPLTVLRAIENRS